MGRAMTHKKLACMLWMELARDPLGKRIEQPQSYPLNEVQKMIGEHFGLKLKINQVGDILRERGFDVKTVKGYPSVKADPKLLPPEGGF